MKTPYNDEITDARIESLFRYSLKRIRKERRFTITIDSSWDRKTCPAHSGHEDDGHDWTPAIIPKIRKE